MRRGWCAIAARGGAASRGGQRGTLVARWDRGGGALQRKSAVFGTHRSVGGNVLTPASWTRAFSTIQSPTKEGSDLENDFPENLFKKGLIMDSKWMETPFHARVFDVFNFSKFNQSELESVFNVVDMNKNGTVEREELRNYLLALRHQVVCQDKASKRNDSLSREQMDAFCDEFMQKFQGKTISREEFDRVILDMANTVDPRVWPLTGMMVACGTAIGLILPIMPLFVKELGLSTSDYGLVVSSFAVSKLLGNIPCAILADKYGRLPLMTSGLAMIAVGMGGVSAVSSLGELMACRLVSGLGVSAFTTAATLSLMDLGNPLNRTKTVAPITAGFNIGTAVGPAIGGVLAGQIGLQPTFLLVGAAFGSMAALNRAMFTETLPRELTLLKAKSQGVAAEALQTVQQWKPLVADKQFRSILGVTLMYWLATSGSYMTLLPLILVQPSLGLSTTEIGGVFMMTSLVNVLATQPGAWVADRFGKSRTIVGAGCAVAACMSAFSLLVEAGQPTAAFATLALWSFSSTVFGMVPTALVTDVVSSKSRSQALALNRTIGDVGLLVGASLTGNVAEMSTENIAMSANAVGLLATTAWFGWISRSYNKGAR